MPEAAWLIATAVAVSLFGFLVLALGQDRHWEAVTGRGADARVRGPVLLPVGLAAQAASCALLVLAQGPGFGALLWGVCMTAAALTVALTLTWRPAALRPLALLIRAALPAS